MKKITHLTLGILMALSLTACGKKGADSGAAVDGCKGIGSMEARMKCVNNSLVFCSSFTGYVFKEQRKCTDKEKCFVAPDGKSGGCK